jgi:hypothetical protein
MFERSGCIGHYPIVGMDQVEASSGEKPVAGLQEAHVKLGCPGNKAWRVQVIRHRCHYLNPCLLPDQRPPVYAPGKHGYLSPELDHGFRQVTYVPAKPAHMIGRILPGKHQDFEPHPLSLRIKLASTTQAQQLRPGPGIGPALEQYLPGNAICV